MDTTEDSENSFQIQMLRAIEENGKDEAKLAAVQQQQVVRKRGQSDVLDPRGVTVAVKRPADGRLLAGRTENRISGWKTSLRTWPRSEHGTQIEIRSHRNATQRVDGGAPEYPAGTAAEEESGRSHAKRMF